MYERDREEEEEEEVETKTVGLLDFWTVDLQSETNSEEMIQQTRQSSKSLGSKLATSFLIFLISLLILSSSHVRLAQCMANKKFLSGFLIALLLGK